VSRAASRESGAPRPGVRLPDPGRFWIRYVPRLWEAPDIPWVDLAEGKLATFYKVRERALEPDDLLALAQAQLDDVFYLPPVPERLADARNHLASSQRAAGTPVLVHLFPGDPLPWTAEGEADGLVFDVLPALLDQDVDRLRLIPAGATAVWPLLPGLTDSPGLWEEGFEALTAAGVTRVQALAPLLSPSDRRRLVERWGDEGAFDALFHQQPPAERDFARAAHLCGFSPFLPRPLPAPPIRGGENRRIAGVLALAAELWLRLGRAVEQGQALYRAARWIDGASYDLKGLARERNLSVLTPLDALSRRLVAECADGSEPPLLTELLAAYVAPEDGSGDNGEREEPE
jgi:hypothetical protein